MGNGCSEKEANLSCLDRPIRPKVVYIPQPKWHQYGKSYEWREPNCDNALYISIDKVGSHKWFWNVRFFDFKDSGLEETLWQAKEKSLSKLMNLMDDKRREISEGMGL